MYLRQFLDWLHHSHDFQWRDTDRIIEGATGKDPNKRPSEVFIDKRVGVCPATRDAYGQGIAVVMSLHLENGTAYYMKVREIVAASEKRAVEQAKPPVRRAG